MRAPETVIIGGIPTARLTRRQLAELMLEDNIAVKEGKADGPRIVVSSNGSVIAAFHRLPNFRHMLMQADIIDADGMPLVLASRLLCKRPLLERVATTDFIHDAAEVAAKNGLKFYFLGGKPGVADRATEILRKKYPGLKVVGVRSGYFSFEEEESICAEIVRNGTDVLWVGLGSPLQEQFAVRNRARLQGVTWIRTCGGLFDHFSGSTKRAPLWVQNIGFEWFVRLVQEPRRLGRRYLISNPVATFHLATKTYD